MIVDYWWADGKGNPDGYRDWQLAIGYWQLATTNGDKQTRFHVVNISVPSCLPSEALAK